MAYEVEIHAAAQKQVLSLPKEPRAKVALAIDDLGTTPRPPRVKKLAGSALWRIWVGQYRIVYAIDDDAHMVTIVRVARRSEDTYRDL